VANEFYTEGGVALNVHSEGEK